MGIDIRSAHPLPIGGNGEPKISARAAQRSGTTIQTVGRRASPHPAKRIERRTGWGDIRRVCFGAIDCRFDRSIPKIGVVVGNLGDPVDQKEGGAHRVDGKVYTRVVTCIDSCPTGTGVGRGDGIPRDAAKSCCIGGSLNVSVVVCDIAGRCIPCRTRNKNEALLIPCGPSGSSDGVDTAVGSAVQIAQLSDRYRVSGSGCQQQHHQSCCKT